MCNAGFSPTPGDAPSSLGGAPSSLGGARQGTKKICPAALTLVVVGCAEAERQDRAHTRGMAAGSIAAMWRPPRQPARREDIPSARPVRGSGILAFFLEVASRQICPRSFSAAKLRLSCGMTKPFPRFSQKEHARGGDRGAPMWQRRRGEKKKWYFCVTFRPAHSSYQ